MTDEEAREMGRRIGRTRLGKLLLPVVELALIAFYLFGITGMFLFLMLALRPRRTKKT